MAPLPVYLVGLPASSLDACRAAFGPGTETVEPPDDWRTFAQKTPGVVLLGAPAATAEILVRAAEALDGPEWTLALLDDEGGPWIRTVSVGRPQSLETVALHVAEPDGTPGTLLALEQVLTEVSRARHEINNPLTSALAETQILLMDAPEGETREALLQIQTQLRRIRDLLIATRHLRPGG